MNQKESDSITALNKVKKQILKKATTFGAQTEIKRCRPAVLGPIAKPESPKKIKKRK